MSRSRGGSNSVEVGAAVEPDGGPDRKARRHTLTARSVVASVLLGTDPPVMAAGSLVRAGELFGIAEGTVRTALSRMAAAGELVKRDDGRYELVGHLAERRRRQLESRQATVDPWGGDWEMWLVTSAARPAEQRGALRRAAISLRLGEARDGVWMRPDNLSRTDEASATARATMSDQAVRLSARPDDDVALAESLWSLEDWNHTARGLRMRMQQLGSTLATDDETVLEAGFLLSAEVLRHLNSDPLLPVELRRAIAGDDDQGAALRRDYDEYDAAYRTQLSRWLRGPVDHSPRG